jgi:hypothetical protein
MRAGPDINNNASRLDPGELPSGVTVVSNDAGITGGIKLWQRI